MAIRIKRAYESVNRSDGRRFLVERLWPRGVRKEALVVEAWPKEVAPSTALRKWFGHQNERWPEFQRRYLRELRADPEAWAPLLAAARRGTVTLIYSAHDPERNSAAVLRDFLARRLTRRRRAPARPRVT